MNQNELEAHEELMEDFRVYLRADQSLSLSTARVYVATLSGAIKKGTFGYDDAAGIQHYFEGLIETRPATAATLQAVWRHFRTYMAVQHGETLCDLGGTAEGLPEAAVVDLRGDLRGIPTSEFIELRWGAVHRSQLGGGYEIKHVDGKGKHTAHVLSERGVAALEVLKRWGYPLGNRTATSLILPQAPNDPAPIMRQRLARIHQRELIRRQRLGVALDQADDLALGVESADVPRTAPAPASMTAREEAPPPAVTPLSEDAKLALYAQWLVEAPPDGFADNLYTNATVPTNTPDKVALARWRRMQWALGRPNDLGPPPQSHLSTPSPSTYAPELPSPAVPVAATAAPGVSYSDVFGEGDSDS
jgi:hypothetical protein